MRILSNQQLCQGLETTSNLITRLNTYPSAIDAEEISALIPQTANLLQTGGIFLLTVQEREDLPVLQEVADRAIPGFSLQVVALGNKNSELTSIGSHALVATKV